MILGFKQQFPDGEPTYFREKILRSADYIVVGNPSKGKQTIEKATFKSKPHIGEWIPKLHTIREDPHNRWKVGNGIQMAYGVRTKNYCQFNKGIPELEKCVSTQKIEIMFSIYAGDMRRCSIVIKEELYWTGQVTKSGANSCAPDERKLIETFAHNDGFKDSVEFFRWFKKDFSGKLIHWTNHKY